MLELRNISKHFPSPPGRPPFCVLDNLSLTVNTGESLAILGPSGSGKSTLLHIMGTLDTPTSGSLHLNGKDLLQLTPNALAQVRNKEVGFIFQLHYLLPQCTVWENVMLPTLGSNTKQDNNRLEARGRHLLERVGLAKHLHYKPAMLSGGERQRVAVVRALINSPALLLADEPTGSLDNTAAENLAVLLKELNQEENVTLVVVTHARSLADQMQKTVVLHNGKLETLNR